MTLRPRYLLLLFYLAQSFWAFADKGDKRPNEEKPDKARIVAGTNKSHVIDEGQTLNRINYNNKKVILRNAQLSSALDKAVAQMGDVMSLMDYSEFPAERATVLVDSTTTNDRAEAQALFDEIAKTNSYIKSINNGAILSLPQGIRWGNVDESGNSAGGNAITVGIASATFKPEYTVLKMYVKIEIETPNSIEGTKKVLFFGSDNMKISQDGGFIGDTRLVLLGDYKIPFGKFDFIMRGGLNKSTGQFADYTYISVDCEGFRELKVTGSLQFPTNVLVKIDPLTGVVESGKNVIGEISASLYDINDLRFEVSLPAFALASAQTWGFVVQGAVFDFSTRTNSPETVFPEKYALDYFPPESDGSLAINTWRGIFVKNLEVLLPREFRRKISATQTVTNRERVVAQNLLIDERGVSGSFSKIPVIPLSDGDASGWNFSVDRLSVVFETNKLVGGSFDGIIQLPIANDATTQLQYNGEIAPVGDMSLTVTLKTGINFDAFKGYIKLTEGTSIRLESRNGKFIPTANINGEMGIYAKKIATGEKAVDEADQKVAVVQIPSIKVQGLVLTGDPALPWISLGYAGYEKEIKLSGFPASITSLAISTSASTCNLRLGVRVALMKDNLAATTVLKFNGVVNPDKKIVSGTPALSIEGIKLEKVDIGPFILDGMAYIKEDRAEQGWGGSLAFYVTKPSEIKIASAVASFGYKQDEDYRYWYVGGSFGSNNQWTDANRPKVGVLGLQHLMFSLFSNCTPNKTITNENDAANVTPKKGTMGFIGLVKMGTASMDAEAGLELALNENWGLNRFGLIGAASFSKAAAAPDVNKMSTKFKNWTTMAKLINSKSPGNGWRTVAYSDFNQADAQKETFKIRLLLNGDFEKGIYHGECDFYVNIGTTLKGNQPYGLAGKITAHVETQANNPKFPGQKMWYFHLGNPDNRITVSANIMGNTFKTGFYVMTGFGLPAAPALPAFYQKALGYKANNYRKPDYGNLAEGTFGTAFGAELSYRQRREYGIGVVYAYYSLKFGLGFDFITRDCGPSGCAATYPGSTSSWLSSAQAYAYLEGSVGVGVDLWLFSAEVELINAGVGAIINANFPKPVGGCANLIVWYKIWKYRGSFDVEYKFGERCNSCNGQAIGCPRDSYK